MKKLNLHAEYLADPSGMRLFNHVQQLFADLKDYQTIDTLGRLVVEELRLIVTARPSSMELVRPAATFASKHCGKVALIVGENGAAFNWFKSTIRSDITINSLSNEEITIEPIRFVELLCRSPSEFLSWVEHIFYYSGRYGGLIEELKHIDDSVVRAIQSYSEFTPKVDVVEVLKSLRGLAYYATQYNRPSQELIADMVNEIRNKNRPCSYPWCFASLLLSQGLGQHVGDSSKFASNCLKNCAETLHPMELMQAVPLVISDDADIEKNAELIIKGLEVSLSQASEDGVTMRANQSRIFPALYPAIKQLALNRRTDLALKVLGAWANSNDAQDSLFIMPYCEEGVFAFDNAGIQHRMIDKHSENIERLTSRFNSFANLCISLRAAQNFVCKLVKSV